MAKFTILPKSLIDPWASHRLKPQLGNCNYDDLILNSGQMRETETSLYYPWHLPCLGKVGPVGHHVPGEDPVLVGVAQGGVERLAKDVVDLVAVHDSRPVGPGVHARPLVEVILVHEVLAHRVTATGGRQKVVVRG